jgi:hemerythrin HHE cation binding domain-containing protein
MTVDTRQFRRAHQHICDTSELRSAAARFPQLGIEERQTIHAETLRYLREEVEPHTRLDEWLLYPATAERLGDPLVAASMRYDHIAIRRYIEELALADVHDTTLVQRLLYGLDALIAVHIWKENELFVRPLESGSWPEPS